MFDPVEDFLVEVVELLVTTSRLDEKAKIGFLYLMDYSKLDPGEPPEEHWEDSSGIALEDYPFSDRDRRTRPLR